MTADPVPLPRSTPAAEGVDARGIAAFLDAVEAAPGVEPHSVMVLRHGRVIAQGWWAPYSADRKQLLYSLSKSFTSTAAGLAVAEGLLSLDDPVLAYFPELDAAITDPRSRAIRVRHLASMSAGHLTDQWEAALTRDHREPVRGFLLGPPEREPGSVFAYSQPCTYTLAAIIQRITGQTLTEYLRPRLLDPLGIGPTAWQQHPPGRELGFTGLFATTDAVARLGQLYLRRGVWAGRRLLSEEWIAEATRPQVATADNSPQGPDSDWALGYGYQFWKSRHGYRGDGAYGQYCLVLPERDAVVAITSGSTDMQRVLDEVWRHLLPALGGPGAAPGPAESTVVDPGTAVAAGFAEAADTPEATGIAEAADTADTVLERRLAGLALPPAAAAPAPPAEAAAEWEGAVFRPAPDGAGPRSLTAVRLGRGVDGWTAVLDEEGTAVALPLVPGAWSVSGDGAPVPAAATGGWAEDGTFRLDVLFLETPHRLSVSCTLPGRAFRARWETHPLGPDRPTALQARVRPGRTAG